MTTETIFDLDVLAQTGESMKTEPHPHDIERQGSGNYDGPPWGQPFKTPVDPKSLESSPPFNRYIFHEGHNS